MIVVYKSKHKVIIKTLKYAKHKSSKHKSILIYSKDNKLNNLKLGYIYNIDVLRITDFYGTKSISKFDIHTKTNKELKLKQDIKTMYLKDIKNEMFKLYNQNEIISNLNGIYKKSYLYFTTNNEQGVKQMKIKIYFTKPLKRPAQNSNILIKKAQLNIFKNKVQITINQLSDYKKL
jgi:hypothetical protein